MLRNRNFAPQEQSLVTAMFNAGVTVCALILTMLGDMDRTADSLASCIIVPVLLLYAMRENRQFDAFLTCRRASALLIAENYPCLLLMLLSFHCRRSFLVICFNYLFRFYCISLLCDVFIFLLPEVCSIFLRVDQFLLHLVRSLLGAAGQIVPEAQTTSEALFSPDGQRRDAEVSSRRRSTYFQSSGPEVANLERLLCSVCISDVRAVLLRPCNHICLCETCFRVVKNSGQPRCPVCRAAIKSHIKVFL